MCEVVKIGVVGSIVGPAIIPEVHKESIILISIVGENNDLYAIPEEIFNYAKFSPGDNVSFILKDPSSQRFPIGLRYINITSGLITYFKKYKSKGVIKKCSRA